MYLGRSRANGATTSQRAIQYMSAGGQRVAAQARTGIQKPKYSP
jgi:hypothetical protein